MLCCLASPTRGYEAFISVYIGLTLPRFHKNDIAIAKAAVLNIWFLEGHFKSIINGYIKVFNFNSEVLQTS